MRQSGGFTLVELLVVIAIIGILAGTVLASLSTSRGRGNDARVKSQLSSARNAAEVYAIANRNNYSATTGAGACTAGMFADASSNFGNIMNSVIDLAGAGNYDCASSASAWSVAVKLPSTNAWWCVDSTGVSRETNSAGTDYTGLQGSGVTFAHNNASANTATLCS